MNHILKQEEIVKEWGWKNFEEFSLEYNSKYKKLFANSEYVGKKINSEPLKE